MFCPLCELPQISCLCSNRKFHSQKLGGPLASSVFLVALSIVGEKRLSTVWRVCFGFGIFLPLVVLIFRLRMLDSKLYRKGAIKSEHDLSPRLDAANANNLITERVPYLLVLKRYWRPLIGTGGVWYGRFFT